MCTKFNRGHSDHMIYNYLCNQCLSPLKLWVRIPLMAQFTTLHDQVCQWHVAGGWFSPDTDHNHDRTEILLNVALNTITLIQIQQYAVQNIATLYIFIYKKVLGFYLHKRKCIATHAVWQNISFLSRHQSLYFLNLHVQIYCWLLRVKLQIFLTYSVED